MTNAKRDRRITVIGPCPNEEESTGIITRIEKRDGYTTVHYHYDGMPYKASTGGQFGDSWVDVYGRPAEVTIKD
jgi:hypothetical protein